MTETYNLIYSPNAAATVNCALYNFSLLNVPVNGIGTQLYTGINPANVQPNLLGKLKGMYQEFTCTGFRVKVSFIRDCYDAVQTIPISVEWAYDDTANLALSVSPGAVNLPAYANYQYGSIPDSQSVSRYLSTAGLKKRLGIGWCDCSDNNWTY